jgi:hypothetical protein
MRLTLSIELGTQNQSGSSHSSYLQFPYILDVASKKEFNPVFA